MEKTNMKKKLPIGIEDFCKLREEGFYYVDKTAMICDLLNAWGEVNLFTRPRRFGKSLNMSMLKTFLEIGCDKFLFDGLAISREKSLCDDYMGKFPVISISLKSVSGEDYDAACSQMCKVMGDEASRFAFLTESDRLLENEKNRYRQLTASNPAGETVYSMSEDVLKSSLQTLSMLLRKHYGKKVVILIDEYDVPLAKANERGYYKKMVNLIRSMFDQALKSNENLYFAVLTGCLRVAKESIFTGLNNPQIFSISTAGFGEYFGFTDTEVRSMLDYYGLADKYVMIKEWYDGYRFGEADVYCPWDVISYCAELRMNSHAMPRDYWSNTSGNDAVRHLIEKAGNEQTKSEIETLVAGETIEKGICEDLTYNHLYDTIDNLWSVLFATGYLTRSGAFDEAPVSQCGTAEENTDIYRLVIPNKEIRRIFTRQITAYFNNMVRKNSRRFEAFCEALKTGDAANTQKLLTSYLYDSITVRDSSTQKDKKEILYHGLMIGILANIDGWKAKTNADSGDGYCDVKVEIEREDIGMIIEFKYADHARLVAGCEDAMAQIERMDYTRELKRMGYHTIYKYGIACFKKKCRVVCEKEEYMPEE
ncbi:MAG: ATP-binding protein [Lachnospiraceae bacterium]|nr:ATP-binding protein [Lachnospiraceae bacterium]